MFIYDEQREPILAQRVYSPGQLFRGYPVEVQVGGVAMVACPWWALGANLERKLETTMSPLRFLTLPAGDLLVSFIIALRPVVFWRLIALGLHAWLSLYLIQVSTGPSVQEYLTRASVAIKFFIAYDFIWLTDPLVDYRHELDKTPPSERSFVYRMYWAMCILLNFRRVGLNSPVRNGFLLHMYISECSHF
jgi:hypothetical protein